MSISTPYTGNPDGGGVTSPAPSVGGAPVVNIMNDGYAISRAQTWEQPLETLADWIAFITQNDGYGSTYGDGSDGYCLFDGSATVLGFVPSAGVYTLNRAIFPSSMIVTGAATVDAYGFPVLVHDSLTVLSGGNINYNGQPGISGFENPGGAGNQNGMLGYGAAGGSGANHDDSGGVISIAGGSIAYSLGGSGGGGVNTGYSNGAAGGSAAVLATGFGGSQILRRYPECVTTLYQGFDTGGFGNGLIMGGAGGGGGGGGHLIGNQGAGGGGGAGVLVVAARVITATGVCFKAVGGTGGSAGGPFGGGVKGSGGGGGGGGVVCVTYSLNLSGSAISTHCSAAGGTPGTGSVSGIAGSAGRVYVNQVT